MEVVPAEPPLRPPPGGIVILTPPTIVCTSLAATGRPAASEPADLGPTAAAVAAFERGQYEESIRLLAPGARAGDPATQFALACIMDGFHQMEISGERSWDRDDPRYAAVERAIRVARRIVALEPLTALEWLERSAEAGFEPAQLELAGRLYSTQSEDWAERSVRWYQRLAARGHPVAMRQLGRLYREGSYRPRDAGEALRLITGAAEAGDREAMLELAGMYRDGRAGRRDPAEMRRWLEQLAAGGDRDANYYLALALLEGDAPDFARALSLLEAASDAGHVHAGYELAALLMRGSGGAADRERGARLRAAAAEAGDCYARLEMLEDRIRSGTAERLDAPAREALRQQFDDTCGGFDWRVSEELDRLSGFRLAGAERRDWERRRQEVRTALGYPVLVAEDIAPALMSGDRDAVAAAIRTLVHNANEGGYLDRAEAIAILAYPAPWLPQGVRDSFDSGRWREVVANGEPQLRRYVNDYILSSPLASRDIEAALALAARGEGEQSAIQRFGILRSLGLHPVAFEEMMSLAARSDNREILNAILQGTIICGYGRMLSDWVALVAGETSDCGGVAALSALPGNQLARLVDLGSYYAQLFLGVDYLYGRTVPRDVDRGVALLESALLEEVALPVLGALFEDARGVRPDLERAARYYSAAVEDFEADPDQFSGVPSIVGRLGRLLLHGRGLPADPERGASWLRYGARNGVALAQTGYGDALWLGLGVAPDRMEALRWYREGAASGDPAALVRFGFLAARGWWNERRLGADRWYELAGQADDPVVWLDLARAAAYASPGPAALARVRDWLQRAAASDNGWAAMWLDACREADSLSCFRRQPHFGGVFAALAAAGRGRGERPDTLRGDERDAAEILAAEVGALNARIEFQLETGAEIEAVLPSFAELERIQLYHRDRDGALASRLRRLLVQDTHLASQHGDLSDYFALVESSCNWGQASRMAHRNGLGQAALLLAKMSVNRLQQARSYLARLDGDVRECFIAVHEDRYRWLADLFIESGRLAEAEAVLGMLKDFEHANYTLDAARRSSARATLAYSPEEGAAAAMMEAAGDTLAESLAAGAAAPRYTAGDATARERERIRSASARFRAELDELIAAVTALDAGAPTSQSGSRADWLDTVQRSIVADLRDDFGPDTVALHAVVLPGRIHWILSTTRGQRSLTIPVRPGELNRRVGDFLEAIHRQSPSVVEPAQALYQLIFAPVDAALRSIPARHLMLSLDGRLRYLPFAALHDGTSWLVQRYSFSHFRRPADYLRSGEGGPWTMAGFGASTGHAGLAELPAVPAELNDIIRTSESDEGIVPGIVQIDDSFTRDAFADALGSEYRVIHIASHFVLDPRSASNSYLLLGRGGRLPLLDFSSDANLTFAHVDLVTLSACQTALGGNYGDGSEVDSVGTVAQDAGAPAVLASLWSVADTSTAEFMLRFYRNRVDGGRPTSDAVRMAQLELLSGGDARRGGVAGAGGARISDYVHPYFWAPFILIGNGQ